MKRYRYAVMDENKRARVLSVNEGENLAPAIKKYNLVIVHPCSSYKDAVKIVEAWRAQQ